MAEGDDLSAGSSACLLSVGGQGEAVRRVDVPRFAPLVLGVAFL